MKIESPPRFIADCHLGKLAKYLRFMGFDTLYFNTISDNELIKLANENKRIILTRDRVLSQRKNSPSFYLNSIENLKQLQLLNEKFDLKSYELKSRCTICNTQLKTIEKSKIEHKLPPKVKIYFEKFEICEMCNRIYWHGDHYKRMMLTVDAC